jgi:hypothetical protein
MSLIGSVYSVEANTYLLQDSNHFKGIFNAKFNYDTKNLKFTTVKVDGSSSVKIKIQLNNDIDGSITKNIPLDGDVHPFDLSNVRIEKGENYIWIDNNPPENKNGYYLNKTLTLHFVANETTGSGSLADTIGSDESGSDNSHDSFLDGISGIVNGALGSAWNTLTGSNGNDVDDSGNDNGSTKDGNPGNVFGGLNSFQVYILLILVILGIIACVYYFKVKK